jgi:peptidyl-prolyl cis-trans isomerase SurA
LVLFCFGQQRVDGIVALVGKNAILHSDVLQQAQFLTMSSGFDVSKNRYLFEKELEKNYLSSIDGLINQYIVLAAAEQDTNIIVSNEEVDRALDMQIEDYILKAGSESLFLEMAGMSMRSVRKEYWQDIRDMMYVERFQYSIIQNIDVSRVEVVDFYNSFKDSLPQKEELYDFSVIEFPLVSSKKTNDAAILFLKSLRDSVLSGKNSFDSLAIKYSQDPGSSLSGGYLGFTQRGTLVKAFEKVAYSMDVGEISSPVKSDFGYHLIKLVDRKGEKVSTQHILRLNSFSNEDRESVLNIAKESYFSLLKDISSFDSLALFYSKKYKNNSGVYLNKTINEVPGALVSVLKEASIKSLSEPFETKEAFILTILYKNQKPVSPNLENSWKKIYVYAKQKKQQDFFNSYVDNLKNSVFVKRFD